MPFRMVFALLVAVALPIRLSAQPVDSLTAAYPASSCSSCAEWNEPQEPFRLFGNTYYVGTRGLSALLITSDSGHVLVDGGLPNSAPLILENVRALGFDVADIELLVNSHAHFDHAGGLAALQHATGARLASSAASAPVLETGLAGRDDPQYEVALAFPGATVTDVFSDGDVLRVGPLELTAHLTPGHTPGGTSWRWQSCQDGRCLSLVYADSQTPVSADGFRYTDSKEYPTAVADFEKSFSVLDTIPCDVLITPHPDASNLWRRHQLGLNALADPAACRQYADRGRQQLHRRLASEAAERQ